MDIIRIIAILLVIFTHTGETGVKLYTVDYMPVSRISQLLALMFDVIREINVPLFFMVSGALMLKKTISYKDLFLKYILRYIFITTAVSYFYYVFYLNGAWYDFSSFFKSIYGSWIVYHLWFLYSYIGYLLMLPLLKSLANGMRKKDYIYFAIIGVLFKGGLHIVGVLMGLGEIGIKCAMVTDNVFYPIMGYFFGVVLSENEYVLSKIKTRIFVIASVICVFANMCIVYWEKSVYGEFTENFLSALTVIPTLSTFYLVRRIFSKCVCPEKIEIIIAWCGELTFGTYLVSVYIQTGKMLLLHELLVQLMPRLPLVATILYVTAVWIVGMVITYMVKLVLNAGQRIKSKCV